MNTDQLPQTDSIQELAAYWDTHDLADHADLLEEVAEPVFARQCGITIRLEAAEADAVQELAKARGLKESELIREWVRERLRVA